MPIVDISWLAGRTVEQKRQVAEQITATMAEVGVNPDALFIVFRDVELENWAIGGTLQSDR